MQSVAGKEEAAGEAGGPTGLNEVEVSGFIGAVELVAEDRVADVGEVDADLMEPPGDRFGAEEGKGVRFAADGNGEAAEGIEAGERVGARRVDALFEVDGARGNTAFAEDGRRNLEVVVGGVARDDGEVGLEGFAASNAGAEAAGGGGGFGDEDDAGGFAVEAVDEGYLAA